MHQARGHNRALLPRVESHGLPVFEKQERRQSTPRFHAPGRYQLRRLKNMQRRKVAVPGFAFVNVGQGGIGSAQVDADFHAATRSRTLNSSFHLRPSRATHQSCSIPVSVTTDSKPTGTTSTLSPASKLTSTGESSSSASPKSSIRSPGLSFLREAEVKKRNSAGCPITRPN